MTASIVTCEQGPRPFLPPVFDRLQCANMEEEGLGDLVLCNDIRYTEGRHTGSSALSCKASSKAASVVFIVHNTRDRSM